MSRALLITLFGSLIMFSSTLAGCGDGLLIVSFKDVPPETGSIDISINLQDNNLGQQPQDDVSITGNFAEAVGLRYPAADISIARLTAKALNSSGICLAKDMKTVEYAGPGKHYVLVDFNLAAGCN
jgi:hypothetical protein